MTTGRPTIQDPELGESVVFVGSRLAIVLALALGVVCVVGLVTANANDGTIGYALTGVVGVLAFCGAALTWRVRLVVGDRGFRYTRPGRTVEVAWSSVSSIGLERWGRGNQLVVRFRGAETAGVPSGATRLRLGRVPFSARLLVIFELMKSRRAAFVVGAYERSREST